MMQHTQKIVALIPAAGKGSRLNLAIPKILLPLNKHDTVLSVLRKKLLTCVDHIHIVVAPQHYDTIKKILEDDIEKNIVSLSIQETPLGMGDAIFNAYAAWQYATTLLIVWGDQVFVSSETFNTALAKHNNQDNQFTVPLIHTNNPYVEYIFKNQILQQVKQSREGDHCAATGYADVGTFVLSTKDLRNVWHRYVATAQKGKLTDEINFLPFLPFLSKQNWRFNHTLVQDKREAQGINTKSDWHFFQNLFEEIHT